MLTPITKINFYTNIILLLWNCCIFYFYSLFPPFIESKLSTITIFEAHLLFFQFFQTSEVLCSILVVGLCLSLFVIYNLKNQLNLTNKDTTTALISMSIITLIFIFMMHYIGGICILIILTMLWILYLISPIINIIK